MDEKKHRGIGGFFEEDEGFPIFGGGSVARGGRSFLAGWRGGSLGGPGQGRGMDFPGGGEGKLRDSEQKIRPQIFRHLAGDELQQPVGRGGGPRA